MGEVYLAQHPRLPRRDALKVLPRDVSSDTAYRTRFAREADLASTLWHPNIVGVHDRGEDDGQLWISMDYVNGRDAARLLASKSRSGLDPRQVANVVTAVAGALDYAHGLGLLHRDVKPANVMISADQKRILLTDFGIIRDLKDISGLTTTNCMVGTVAYAAPEQLRGHDIDGRADQYALAVTAYQLLTGSLLFPNSNPAVVIGSHLSETPPALADTQPHLAAVDPALAIALAKDPKSRFKNCADFARAFALATAQVATTHYDEPQHADTAGRAPTQPAAQKPSRSQQAEKHRIPAACRTRHEDPITEAGCGGCEEIAAKKDRQPAPTAPAGRYRGSRAEETNRPEAACSQQAEKHCILNACRTCRDDHATEASRGGCEENTGEANRGRAAHCPYHEGNRNFRAADARASDHARPHARVHAAKRRLGRTSVAASGTDGLHSDPDRLCGSDLFHADWPLTKEEPLSFTVMLSVLTVVGAFSSNLG